MVNKRVRKQKNDTNHVESENILTKCNDEIDTLRDSDDQGTSTRTRTCSVVLCKNGFDSLESVPHEDLILPENVKKSIKACSIRLKDCRTNSKFRKSKNNTGVIDVCDQHGILKGAIQIHQKQQEYKSKPSAQSRMDNMQTPSEFRCSSRIKSTSSMSTPQAALSEGSSSSSEDLFGFEKLLEKVSRPKISFKISPIAEKTKAAKRARESKRKVASKEQPKPWEGLLESSVSDIFKKSKKQKQKDKNTEGPKDNSNSDVRLFEYSKEMDPVPIKIKEPISLSFEEDEESSPKKKSTKAIVPKLNLTDARVEMEEVLSHELVVE